MPFAKPGDVTCCPAGAVACPSAPAGGPWRLLTDFSDEFAVSTNLSNVGQPYAILPLNASKWQTNVRGRTRPHLELRHPSSKSCGSLREIKLRGAGGGAQVSSAGDTTWDPANVRTVAQLPGAPNDDAAGCADLATVPTHGPCRNRATESLSKSVAK